MNLYAPSTFLYVRYEDMSRAKPASGREDTFYSTMMLFP